MWHQHRIDSEYKQENAIRLLVTVKRWRKFWAQRNACRPVETRHDNTISSSLQEWYFIYKTPTPLWRYSPLVIMSISDNDRIRYKLPKIFDPKVPEGFAYLILKTIALTTANTSVSKSLLPTRSWIFCSSTRSAKMNCCRKITLRSIAKCAESSIGMKLKIGW